QVNSHHVPEANQAPAVAEEKNKKRLPPALLIVSIVLFLLSIALLIASLVMFEKQTPNHTIGTRPARTDILEPWVNPSGLDSADSYAVATAKVIDSVVVITTEVSSGSGVIWASHEDFSYILTCHHVIDGAENVKITLHGGDVFAAELVGSDARTDIAILRIDEPDLPAIVLPSNDHTLSLGQAVIAIGNPLGTLGNSVTNGILSSLTRTLTIEGSTMELMQTNAAVNHGNSGGGLFDLNGQLIGLVNAKSSGSSVEGIGFAIPYTTLKTIASELVEKGYVSGRPRLGITSVSVNSADSYYAAIDDYPDLEEIITKKSLFGTTYRAGIYIVDTSLVKGYAEGSDSLAFGDKLTTINGTSITSLTDILSVLNTLSAGDTVQITVVRENKTVSVELILGEAGQ
ncbi:MAG: trypsin-like peptidase domain-containing protein, partial [Clostridia bacterium]|nr:trypsin-like peptidase domain-containing protein [Clostridia bacterium]